jgi:outer membrane protein assembly factor BamB
MDRFVGGMLRWPDRLWSGIVEREWVSRAGADGYLSRYRPLVGLAGGRSAKLWEAKVATGWSAPSVADGLVYIVGVTSNNQGQGQAFTMDGKEAFVAGYGPEKPGQAPRTTPLIADGRLFYESNLGFLHCLDAKTGAKIWSADINALGDTSTLVDGVSGSPLVYRGLVIVSSRCKTNDDPSLVAFDVKTGKLAWKGNFGPCPESGKTWSSDHQSPILVDTG